jgi:hypothetical protein
MAVMTKPGKLIQVEKQSNRDPLKPLRISLTNLYANGDYTATVQVGKQKKAANLIVDTGSSTLAFDGKFYNPSDDKHATITNIAQDVTYAGGDWIGAVVESNVQFGNAQLAKTALAVTYLESKNFFGQANGILGLAYTRLNKAYTLPGKTWPPAYHYNQIQDGKVTFLKPYFTQLEQAGLIANKFAFYTRRSMVSHAKPDPSSDPLNQGVLVLGGGEESTDLYDAAKPAVTVRVLDDQWYNTNLKAVIVGKTDPISVLPPTKASGNLSNSIIDSGTNSLVFSQPLFNAVIERFSQGENRQFLQWMRAGYLPMGNLNRKLWPNLVFVLEGLTGDVRLTVTPQNYWQVNAPERGYATARLLGDGGQLEGQSILGLPLMNGYFTIFDRSVDRLGIIKFAPRL